MLTIVGGTYREICLHPRWDQTFGSGLRAAAAVSSIANGSQIELHTWVRSSRRMDLEAIADSFRLRVQIQTRFDDIEFQYDHALAIPRLFPDREAIVPITVDAITGELVLCFGLIECKPPINADVLVFDPQAGHRARPPSVNEYKFSRLAIVANFKEICSMLFTPMAPDGHMHSPSSAGESLRKQEGCEVVVVKNGVEGATVVTAERTAHVPSVRTESVFPIGSGDVFSGVFATHWAALGKDPVDAARLASASTAHYCSNRALPIPSDLPEIEGAERKQSIGRRSDHLARVYLAGPVFTLTQLWLLNETKRCLEEHGLRVFSPKDEVGFLDDPSNARRIAQADLQGLEACDLVFALLDGLDPGTIFEVGYAQNWPTRCGVR